MFVDHLTNEMLSLIFSLALYVQLEKFPNFV